VLSVVLHSGRVEISTIDNNDGSSKTASCEYKKLAVSIIEKYGTNLVAVAQIKTTLKLNEVGVQIINDLRGQK
jgi:hypothetical protein